MTKGYTPAKRQGTARTVLITPDEGFQKVADGEWWDTVGIDLVPEAEVDRYLAQNPGVGIMMMQHEDV